MTKYLMFIDDADDIATYPLERLISITCAADGVLLLHFDSSVGKSDGGDLVTLTITANKEEIVANDILKSIISSQNDIIVIANDLKVAAKASIEIVDISNNNTTDINNLHGTNGMTLTDTAGTSKEYIFDKTGTMGATGASHADGIVIQVNGMSSATDVANQVQAAINSSNGHGSAGTATMTLERATTGGGVVTVGNVVYLTQVVKGINGNNIISAGSLPVPNYIRFRGFSGGEDGKYVSKHITACAITLDT